MRNWAYAQNTVLCISSLISQSACTNSVNYYFSSIKVYSDCDKNVNRYSMLYLIIEIAFARLVYVTDSVKTMLINITEINL